MNLSIRPDAAYTNRATNLHTPTSRATAPPPRAESESLTRDVQSKMREQFAAKAQDPRAFHDLMGQVYGPNYDQGKAEELRQKALAGDFSWMPPVRLVDAETLHGANGAYDAASGTVFINADIAARDPDLAASTYVEEAGAHLDSMLNKTDTLGDEGEMFRRLMSGEKLSQADIAEIRADDDRGTITVDGKQIQVEFWNPFSAVKKAAKGIGNAVKSAASHAWNAVKSTGSALKDAGKKIQDGLLAAGDKLMGGLGKMTIGFGKNLIQGKVGAAFQSIFDGATDVVLGMPKQLVRTVVDGARDAVKSVTHLLPNVIGKHVRNGLDKVFNFVGGAFDKTFDFVNRVVHVFTNPVAGFFGDLETSVRQLLNGDFKDAAKTFGKSFLNLPSRIFDNLTLPGSGEDPPVTVPA